MKSTSEKSGFIVLRAIILLLILIMFIKPSYSEVLTQDTIKNRINDNFQANPKENLRLYNILIDNPQTTLPARAILYDIAGLSYFYLGNHDSSLYLFNYADTLYTKLGYQKRLTSLTIKKANVFFYKGYFADAYRLYHKAIAASLLQNNPIAIAECYQNIGLVLWYAGKYDEALKNFLIALDTFYELNDTNNIATVLNNAATIYAITGQNQKALDVFYQTASLYRKLNLPVGLASVYINIGRMKKQMSDFDGALNYYFKAIDILERINHLPGMLNCYSNLGNLYIYLEEWGEAEKCFNKVHQISLQTKSKLDATAALNNLARISISKGEYEKATKMLHQSIEISSNVKNMPDLMGAYKYACEVYAEMGDYKMALNYHRKLVELNDSIKSESVQKRVVEMEARYNRQRSEFQKTELRYQLDVSQAKSQRGKAKLLVLGVVLLSVVIGAAVYTHYQKINNRHKDQMNKKLDVLNTTLEAKLKTIEHQNIKLAENAQALKEAIYTKDRLFQILTHDLKNPIGALISFTTLLQDEDMKFDLNEKGEIIDNIRLSAKQMNHFLNNMLLWSNAQTGKLRPEPELFEIDTLIVEVIEMHKLALKNKDISISVGMGESNKVYADRKMIFIVLSNLLSNAVKYTPDGGSIDIASGRVEDSVFVRVADTGIGMSDDIVEKIFSSGHSLIRAGTNNEKGTGLGLAISQELAQLNEGLIKVGNFSSKGSVFTLELRSQNEIESNREGVNLEIV